MTILLFAEWWKADRQNCDADNMKEATEAVEREEMGWLVASKQFNVPHTTLQEEEHKTGIK